MKKTKLFALFLAFMVACGCDSAAPDTPANNDEQTLSASGVPVHDHDDMPDDTPWNSGELTVMETDTGYYSNYTRTMGLHYCEKSTGTDIFLCPKPECQHNGGNKCVATYKNLPVANTVMYNGGIYIVTFESEGDRTAVSLYRAETDGSALDRIGDAFAVSYSNENVEFSYEPFIIHRGYAYIPYKVMFGSDFAGAGMVRMDIVTGDKEQIYTCADAGRGIPLKLRAAGEYVYFDIAGLILSEMGTHRYSLKDGSVTILREKREVYDMETKEYIYCVGLNTVSLYDVETVKPIIEIPNIELKDIPMDNSKWRFMPYDGKFFAFTSEKVQIHGEDGKLLGKIAVPENKESEYGYKIAPDSFKISDGKVYVFCRYPLWDIMQDEGDKFIETAFKNEYDVYSCPIGDILSGSGSWEKAYSIGYDIEAYAGR